MSESHMQDLIAAAKRVAEERWGDQDDAGAAALRLENGDIVTSVFVASPNDGATLCHETGGICEAHKRNLNVVDTVCVSREKPDLPFIVLSPCGICQERLAYWGPEVRAAVPLPDDPTSWQVKTLAELQPHYWARAFSCWEDRA
jgi:cytidine deaminase